MAIMSQVMERSSAKMKMDNLSIRTTTFCRQTTRDKPSSFLPKLRPLNLPTKSSTKMEIFFRQTPVDLQLVLTVDPSSLIPLVIPLVRTVHPSRRTNKAATWQSWMFRLLLVL
ncbi:hypothetical protein WR25_15808 [Diploscapter pachys]|uniref:Uncharacterized protein n=1 Tax=Diploscapter pachys TaxID=2018661 RepID=A0A2A2KVY4_9BILA|nr:hypothetical protein WR25_15808 [Diploscapter pachys]